MRKPPKLCHHKATNQAYVTLAGKRVYLGRWDAPDIQTKYDRLLAEWLAGGRTHPAEAERGLLLVELLARYLDFAETYYRTPTGEIAPSIERVHTAIAGLREIYGDIEAAKFGPLCLRAMQEKWIGDGDNVRSAKRVNDLVSATKRIFKWAVAHELIPVTVYQALTCVEGLKQGRSRAKDSVKVRPVPEPHIEAIQPHVSSVVWAIVQLQLVTGARSSELLGLRPCDINTADPACWSVALAHHKTAHHGKDRTLYLGPKAQAIVRPYLDRPLDSFLFSPRESYAERRALERKDPDRGGRRENQLPNPVKTTRKMGDRYTHASYCKAIRRGCERAGVPHWHPHQLRHNAATALRKHFGVEAAGVILGHSRVNVTELYAERNEGRAREIVAKLG